MMNQAKKSYLNINKYIEKGVPEVEQSSGLLGRTKKKTDMPKGQREPKERMARLVKNIRDARMEIRNGT